MMMTGRAKNLRKRNPKDKYATPMWCIEGLLRTKWLPGIKPGLERIVDIGAGDGRIGNTIAKAAGIQNPGKVELITIEPEPDGDLVPTYAGDFQQWAREIYACPMIAVRTVFVSNPPFSQSLEIVELTLDLLNGGTYCRPDSWAFFLLRMDWRASKRVQKLLAKYSIAVEMPLTPRPSFCTGASGSKTDFYNVAWHGWTNERTVRWSWPIVRA
jgi:hypothetical protein